MDRLASMQTFARVAKLSSFTGAADELGISRTLASRRISELEAALGVRLLNRSTRSVSLTQAGASYAELCERVLADIRAGEEAIAAARTEVEGEVALLCPIWVGTFDVTEAIAEFCARHPGVSVRLQFADPSANPRDFLDQGYDICIHPDRIRDSAVMIRKIGDVGYVLAAAPAYLARRGSPRSLAELAEHDWIVKSSDAAWQFKGGGRLAKAEARFSSNSFFSLCTAAAAGLGVVMLPGRIAAPDLRSGTLLPVLPEVRPEDRPLYASYAPGDLPRRVRLMVSFLAEWFKRRAGEETLVGHVGRAYAEVRSRPPD